MMRKFFGTMLVAMLVAVSTQTAAAQGFAPGYMDIGPTLGLGGVGDASLAFGGRFEKGIKTLPSMGDGVLGVQIGVQFYSWSFGSGYSISYIPIGATANYHFKMTDTKFDPFVGAGLGFEIVSCDVPGPFGCSGFSSGIFFIGRLGARYFVSDKMAVYGDLGAGGSTLNVGLMFRLK
jgi:hypothetical protein